MADSLLKNRNLRIIFLITLISVMGVASITPAFPSIARHFGLNMHNVGLLIITFTLPGVVLTPLLGVLSDRIGRKKILIPSLLLFGMAGAGCLIVNDFNLLLLMRLFQGTGAAAIGSLNITLIGDIFEGPERASAMGLNAGVLSIATASYPFIGGALASVTWSAPFYLTLLAFPAAFFSARFLKNPEPQKGETLKSYLKNTFSSLKNKYALLLFLASIVTFILLYGSFLTYIPVMLDQKFSTGPFLIGVVLGAMSLTTAVVSSRLSTFYKKFPGRVLLRISFLLYGTGLLLIPFMPSVALIFPAIIIYGLGHGLNIPVNQTLLAAVAPMKYRGAFMSMNGMLLRLGQTLGPLIMGAVYTGLKMNAVFIAGAAFAIVMSFLLKFLPADNES
ncbi:MAG: MFS transporter [Ignavibacteriaceae bacterium]|nr:MFS transporter [Ignavibacteriaceae bacterium]NUM70971.1 MFS transporter [Ignavibacteriaceae bacterium]